MSIDHHYHHHQTLLFAILLIAFLASSCVEGQRNAGHDDVIRITSNAIEDFAVLESMAAEDDDPTTQQASTSQVLIAILRRGKQMIKLLPRLGLIVARKVLDRIPTPREVLNFGKQTLIGVPQEVIAYAIDAVCTSSISYKVLRPLFTPSVHDMNYILMTADGADYTVPLNDSAALWRLPQFRQDWRVAIVVTGWNSNVNVSNEALETLYAAFRCRDQYNFVVIDTAQFVDTLYTWSAFSSQPVGEIIGEALVELTRFVDVNAIHLIGHSLGAHICGEAGRKYQSLTNRSLARITGLDPARPCFNEGERLNGLQRGDAHFIDVIHTNAGILGMKDPIGDIDFYPNGRDPLQPGCWTIFCAHSRSYHYFAETVYPGNERNFVGIKCHSMAAYRQRRCEGAPVVMGLATPWTARGSFYLETNKKSPFGRHKRRTSSWWWFGRIVHPPVAECPRV